MARYIDADKLTYSRVRIIHSDGTMGGWNAVVMSSVIKDAPAADVVEVRHGEWIDKPTGAYGRMQSWCSACGKHSGIGGIESNRHKPYCPNCGAKIGGERKDIP